MYELIHAERASITVTRACRVLQVARSGYYKWLHAEPSTRCVDDAVLAAEVKEVFRENYGALSGGADHGRARSGLRV